MPQNRGLRLKKEIEGKPNLFGRLRFETVRGMRHLQFLLLEHSFFKDSEEGSALPLNLPFPLFPFSLMLHIAKTRALDLLKLPCYFVKIETKMVGLFAIQEQNESLVIASLGVAKEYRRRGIGTYILGCIETIARHMGKKRLEVGVWRKNIPAQRLYRKYGFKFTQSERIFCKMSLETA